MDVPPMTPAQAVETKDLRLPTRPNWAAFDSLLIDKENAAVLELERTRTINERNLAMVVYYFGEVGGAQAQGRGPQGGFGRAID